MPRTIFLVTVCGDQRRHSRTCPRFFATQVLQRRLWCGLLVIYYSQLCYCPQLIQLLVGEVTTCWMFDRQTGLPTDRATLNIVPLSSAMRDICALQLKGHSLPKDGGQYVLSAVDTFLLFKQRPPWHGDLNRSGSILG